MCASASALFRRPADGPLIPHCISIMMSAGGLEDILCALTFDMRPAELKRHKTERHTAAVGVREEFVLGAATPPDTVVRRPLRFEPRLQRGQDLPLLCETLDDDAIHASALTFALSGAPPRTQTKRALLIGASALERAVRAHCKHAWLALWPRYAAA